MKASRCVNRLAGCAGFGTVCLIVPQAKTDVKKGQTLSWFLSRTAQPSLFCSQFLFVPPVGCSAPPDLKTAVAAKPKILIFDEATSALDNITQKAVSDALDRLKCTRIVIAHRLSTIRNCDRILVLDHGSVIEEGTYDELIERKGFFAELVARQQV